ncbi:hypothetical protein PHYPO_G00124040 [Pangasianodon hypophthalmus]|uniref:Uncharacterized protein n=1 Tax=Pangasianodon hypophthalmus TaxID=310915 RepID=A0A5N5KZT5_PANHP|nr:hypothetical protein PHYPO_G00124040 [Pangasianodon hypophthalmus]
MNLSINVSSKAHKRYSSVLPSSHSVDEVKEVHFTSGHEGKEDTAADSTDGVNGVGSSISCQPVSVRLQICPGEAPPTLNPLPVPPVEFTCGPPDQREHLTLLARSRGGASAEKKEAEKAESSLPYREPPSTRTP